MGKIDWKDMPDRYIVSGFPDIHLPDNGISTTKYTAFTFVPKNLMEQFSKLANVYFFVISSQNYMHNLFIDYRTFTNDSSNFRF